MRTIPLLLAAINLLVIGASAGVLSGAWQTEVSFSPDEFLCGADMDLGIDWSDRSFDASLEVSLSEDGLEGLLLSGACSLGGVDLDLSVDLRPYGLLLDSMESSAKWDAWSIGWEAGLSLAGYPPNPSLELIADGHLPCGQWDLEIEWGGCGCQFLELTFAADGLRFPCVGEIGTEFCVDENGFDRAGITIEEIPLPGLTFILMEAELAFELDGKTWSTSFRLSPDASETCIGMGLRLVTEDRLITGVQITNIDWDIEVADLKLSYAHTDAWDSVSLAGGGTGTEDISWTARAYLEETSTKLFDVDSVSFDLRWVCSSSLTAAVRIEYATAGDVEVAMTLKGRW